MKTLLFLISLTYTQVLYAAQSEIIFKCQSIINLNDPNYIQGSEVYLDIFYNVKSRKSHLKINPHDSKQTIILNEEESTQSILNLDQSFIYFEWIRNLKKSYLSLVYLGLNKWGAYLDFNNELDSDITHSLNKIELMCLETNALTLIKP